MECKSGKEKVSYILGKVPVEISHEITFVTHKGQFQSKILLV